MWLVHPRLGRWLKEGVRKMRFQVWSRGQLWANGPHCSGQGIRETQVACLRANHIWSLSNDSTQILNEISRNQPFSYEERTGEVTRGWHQYRRNNWRYLGGFDIFPTRSMLARLFTVKVCDTEAILQLTQIWRTLHLNMYSRVSSPKLYSFRPSAACVSHKEVW